MPSVRTDTDSDQGTTQGTTDFSQSFFNWTRANSRALSIAASVIVVAGAGYWFYMRSKQIQEMNAEKALNTAKQSMQAGNIPLAQSDIQKVYARYEGTAAGVQAGMLLAQMDFDTGKSQDGISILEKLAGSSSASSMQATILSLEGDGYSQMGKPDEAAKKYDAAADATRFELEKAYQRSKAARAYQAAGNVAKAREIWTQLANDPSAVSMSSEAHVRLGELIAQPAK
ncbi:MAG: tetratricopeptide repeat protein [Gemmatimonadaceae bacterium]